MPGLRRLGTKYPDCLHGLLYGPFLLSYSVFLLYFSFLGRALD